MQRLGKNLGGYFGERIDVAALLREMESVATQHGWTVTTFHTVENFPCYALHRAPVQPSERAPRIYLSAGIHGDEPAGPLAALRLLRENTWPSHAELFLLPCLNPAGFARNTRENGQGIDLNRDYLEARSEEIRAHITWLETQAAFDLCLCLHEDWESNGFYLYELNPLRRPSLAEAIVGAVAEVCPVDQAEIIEDREAKGGIIRPNLDPRTRPLWPESFWLIMHETNLSYTLEAPSDFPLSTRVDGLVAAVNAAVRTPML